MSIERQTGSKRQKGAVAATTADVAAPAANDAAKWSTILPRSNDLFVLRLLRPSGRELHAEEGVRSISSPHIFFLFAFIFAKSTRDRRTTRRTEGKRVE